MEKVKKIIKSTSKVDTLKKTVIIKLESKIEN